jgi:altronate dehydratase small subunit
MGSNTTTDRRVLLLAPDDNIAVAASELAPGTRVLVGGKAIEIKARVDVGHKFAVKPIAAGERIVKYRTPIGSATAAIGLGDYVHTHNMASDYIPTYTLEAGQQYVKEASA